MWEEIARSPAHTDTDEYFRCCGVEIYPSDSVGGGWNQPVVAMDVDGQYDMEDDDLQD